MINVVELYEREDEYAVYHEDDPDIPTIRIKLPSLEEYWGLPWEEAIKKVDGYGLPPEDQHFENYRRLGYYNLPDRLKNLDNIVRVKLKKKNEEVVLPQNLFDELESDSIAYAEEIAYIHEQNKRKQNGHWVFIKGKPTYIDGYHYVYLMCWPVNNNKRKDRLPFYRDIDRRIFLYYKWAYTTRLATFKYVLTYRSKLGEVGTKYFNNKKSAESWAVSHGCISFYLEEFNGSIALDNRVCYGVVFPKRRRVGGTTQSVCFGTMITLDSPAGMFAIQALTEQTAQQDVYEKKFLSAYSKVWFFWKPAHGTNNAKRFKLEPPSAHPLSKDIPVHGGVIIPRSSDNKAFDGNEIRAYLNDESGKKKEGNILFEFSDTIKNTLAYGDSIHGFAMYVSTLGEFEKGGGKEFAEMCRRSFPDNLDDNGHTQTGLYVLFMPAYDGYDRCIDKYGYSVIDDPDTPYINLEGEKRHQGAKSIMRNKRMILEKDKAWMLLNNEIRSNPWTFREAISKAVKGETWDNTEAIRGRISTIKFNDVPLTRRVNLKWSDGLSISQRPFDPTQKVVVEDDDNGRWFISLLPPENQRNLVVKKGDTYGPSTITMSKFILGVDPFKYNESDLASSTKSPSKGAMVLKYKHDPMIDGENKPKDMWVSNRYVLHYLARPTLDVFCEDVLKVCVLYGCYVNTENNVDIVIDRFRQWGVDGFLMYLIDPVTEKLLNKPGTYTTQSVHQRGFSLIQQHLAEHIDRECHLEILEQVLDTEDFSDVTRNDLFSATMMAEIGDQNPVTRMIQNANNKIDLGGFVRRYS